MEQIPVKILLVDDRDENLLALSHLLAGEAVEILTATSGREALELLLQHEVALAILDVQMPEMDGFELAELMRGTTRTRGIPIIFLTAGAVDEQRRFKGYEAGAVDFLFKPVEPLILCSKVNVFSELYRSRFEIAHQRDELEALLDTNQALLAQAKAAHEAVVVGERRLKAMADNMAQLAWMADEHGDVFWLNKRWFEFTGVDPSDIHNHYINLVHPDHQEEVARSFRESVQNGAPWEATLGIRSRTGEYHWFLSRAVPIRDDKGAVVQWFGTDTDITELRNLEERLRRSERSLQELNQNLEHKVQERTVELENKNRELQQFAFIASHDLQEPLRKIQTFADLLITDYSSRLDETAHYYLDRMKNAAARLSELLRDMLAFSRVSTHQQPLTRVLLSRLVEEVSRDLDFLIEGTGAMIEMEGDAELHVDANQVRQLINHLVLNSIKFQTPGNRPHIRVSVSTSVEDDDNPFARITFSDNGIGFDPAFAERIFEPFQRLHEHGKYPGTGMGLAICRRIVERHGGKMTAESTPGGGSRFWVELPVGRTVLAT